MSRVRDEGVEAAASPERVGHLARAVGSTTGSELGTLTPCRSATDDGASPASHFATNSAQTAFDLFAFVMPRDDAIPRTFATRGGSDGYAETITEDGAAEWTPKAWLERVTSKPGADPPPDGDGQPTSSNDNA
jgi:hypothetical protein